jgi:lipoprotein-releasing system permease protein
MLISSNLRIAFRFLTAKKRSMLMSLSCIVLGVGLFVVTQAATTGFEVFFIQTILGADGAILIQDRLQATQRSMAAGGYGSGFAIESKEGVKYVEGIDEPAGLKKVLETFGSISGISVVLKGQVDITSPLKTETNMRVYGIDVAEHLKVSNLAAQIVDGSLDKFAGNLTGALLGREMADRMQLNVGDSFQLEAVGQTRRYRVSAIYETGVSDIDRYRLYLNMAEARSLLQKPTGASFIQLQLYNPDSAPVVAEHLQLVLGYSAQPWQERQKSWLTAFRALRVASGITVSVFTFIAGLAMFNTLAMIVLEKTKDIAILRSMGYERRDITRIFLWQAVVVLLIGALLGALVGAVGTEAVAHIPLPINGIFKTEHFQVFRSPWHYAQAVATAIVMVMIASLVPSRRAARLEPGDIIRGTAQ